MRAFARAGAPLVALALAGCLPDKGVGYVEIKVFPALPVALYLNAVKLDALKNGTAVLRQDVGPAKLQLERNGQLALLCEFDVKKNRVITVNVSTIDRGARCEVQK